MSVKLYSTSVAIIAILSNFQIKVHCVDASTLKCGKRLVNHEALIVNGYKSKEGDWPWHASILHIDLDQNIQYKCGGTLLNENSILTAAHCVYENSRPLVPDRILIQLGRNNIKVSGPHSQDIEAYQTFPHHHFNVSSLANDIAIVRLATLVTFNNYVQPICLWDSNKEDLLDVVGKFGTVVGFGITEKNRISYTLRQAVIPVVDATTCLESDRNFFGQFLSSSTFCAGYRNGTSACNGDSGGSLTFEENGVYRIRGIVSLTQVRLGNHQQFCKTDQFVVFTDVAKYVAWIREMMPGLPSTETSSKSAPPGLNYCYFLKNDLTDARIERDDCEERCTSTPLCTHYTWTDHNGGTCWMKQNKVTANDAYQSLDEAAVCGIVKNSAHISWNDGDWALGCEFWENDLASVKSKGEECSIQCVFTEGCTHYTWTDYDGGTCRMKQNSIGKKDAFVSKDKSSVCGIVKGTQWGGRNWAIGCEFRDYDVENVKSKGEECGQLCASNPQCTHFTWNDASGGTCWMKQYEGVTKNDAVITLDPSSVCGVIRNSTTSKL